MPSEYERLPTLPPLPSTAIIQLHKWNGTLYVMGSLRPGVLRTAIPDGASSSHRCDSCQLSLKVNSLFSLVMAESLKIKHR